MRRHGWPSRTTSRLVVPTPRPGWPCSCWGPARRRRHSSRRKTGEDAVSDAASLKRRTFLSGAGAVLAGGMATKLLVDRDERSRRADVFIASASSYSVDLESKIRDGLAALGFGRAQVAGK